MALNDAARRLFDPVDVSGNEGVAEPGNAENTDTGAHPGFKGAGVQDAVGIYVAYQGGQRSNAEHDDQDRAGGVHQRCCHQAEARAVDDGVSHDADHAEQEQQNRELRPRLDLHNTLTAQGDQPLFQTTAGDRIGG